MAILFLADGVATALLLAAGAIREVNPLLAHLSPFQILGVKLCVLVGALPILWRYRERSLARRTILPTLVGYAALAAYHIYLILYLTGTVPA
jgi:hypothetical protein